MCIPWVLTKLSLFQVSSVPIWLNRSLKQLKLSAGGCCRSTARTYVVGGWAWAWWLVCDVQRLKLEVMTLTPKCESVETSQGVPLTVTAVAQCKITTERDYLAVAAEQFLGKESSHIKSVILQTLEGHLRAILGTLTVEEVYRDRDQFASLVREVAAPDVSRMGIEILSFTIKEVHDEVDYLASLGKAKTAEVKKNAKVGVAQAERDAGIREAECEKAALDAKYVSDAKIEEARRQLNVQKALFDQEINSKKEVAKLAYELQAAQIQQQIRAAEKDIEVTERQEMAKVHQKEIERKHLELKATVTLPAEAESYKLKRIAEGLKIQTSEAATSKARGLRLVGTAEAEAIESVGRAEAERMRLRANAYRQYNDAAILSMTLEALPKLAAEVAAPLSKTDEIVILGGQPSQLANLISTIPPTVHAVTSSDVGKVSLLIYLFVLSETVTSGYHSVFR